MVTCPTGQQHRSWLPSTSPQKGTVWEVRFARHDGPPCPARARCTRAKREPRIVGLRAREQEAAIQHARPHQATAAFRAQDAPRAGVESTPAQGTRRWGRRPARSIGLARTHLQHVATAAALNLVRLGQWWLGTPVAKTRRSPFARLQPAAAEWPAPRTSPPVSTLGLGHPGLLADALYWSGFYLSFSDLGRAVALSEELLALGRARGDEHAVVWTLLILGQADRLAGDSARTEAHLRQALVLSRRTADWFYISYELQHRGELAEDEGEQRRKGLSRYCAA